MDTSNDELDRPLPKSKNKKVIGLMKDVLDGKIVKKLLGLRAKVYRSLMYDNSEDYKNFLEATQLEKKINHQGKDEINLDSFKKDNKESIKKQ